MVTAARLLTSAAEEVVQDLNEPYGEYHADLVLAFARTLQILRNEPERAQRREIEVLITRFAAEMNTKVEES